MGEYTPAKYEYDRLAREFFEARGYVTHIVGKGNRPPDLVAWNAASEKFAVIEVKSPDERDAWTSQVYQQRDYNLCGIPRKKIRDRVKAHVKRGRWGIAYLVGVTISNQLYCYYWDALEQPALYDDVLSKERGIPTPLSSDYVEPYLVVPVEWKPVVEAVSNYFYSEGCLPRLPIIETTQDLCVAQIFYPGSPPPDLATRA